jgi:serine/threonine protein kinase
MKKYVYDYCLTPEYEKKKKDLFKEVDTKDFINSPIEKNEEESKLDKDEIIQNLKEEIKVKNKKIEDLTNKEKIISLFVHSLKSQYLIDHKKLIDIDEDDIICKNKNSSVFKGTLKILPINEDEKKCSKRGKIKTKTDVIIKTINNMSTKEIWEKDINEITLGIILTHKNIVKFLGWYSYQGNPSIVMEPMKYSLETYLKEKKPDISEIYYILSEILEGMNYLHENCNTIHRDLKTQNILIEGGAVKICDFGTTITKLKDFNQKYQTTTNINIKDDYCGTLSYSAPETFEEGDYTKFSDYFSFGMIIYEILEGIKPFSQLTDIKESNYKDFYNQIYEKHGANFAKLLEVKNISEKRNNCEKIKCLSDLMANLIRFHPYHRPKYYDVKRILEIREIWK